MHRCPILLCARARAARPLEAEKKKRGERGESGAGEEVAGEEGDASMRMSLAHRLEAMTDSAVAKAEGDAPADEASTSSPPSIKFAQRRPSVDRRGERESRRRSVDPSRVSAAAGGGESFNAKKRSQGQDDDSGSSKVGMGARRGSQQVRSTGVKNSVLGAALAAEGVSTIPPADSSRAPHPPHHATLCTPPSSQAHHAAPLSRSQACHSGSAPTMVKGGRVAAR